MQVISAYLVAGLPLIPADIDRSYVEDYKGPPRF